MGLKGFLSQTEPFQHLPSEALREIAHVATEKVYPKEAVIFREGEPATSLWVLQSGWVQLVKLSLDGKTLTLDLVTPQDGVCGLSAFSGHTYLASAIAATPVKALQIPSKMVRRFLKSHPQFSACVMGIFSHRFHHMAAAYANAYAPVEQRVASVLLRLDEDFGTTLPVTRREIANLAGTTVETAIRVTNQMRRENLLLMRRGQIILVSPRGLTKKLNQEVKKL